MSDHLTATNSTHQVKVVRVGEILNHPNADRLSITMVGGYQVVIGKDNFKEGDLAIYIQPDSVVPQTEPFKFIWETYVGIDGTVPEKRRRIGVKKLRKEVSEGFLMPLSDVGITEWQTYKLGDCPSYKEGDDVAELIGITHYDPPEELGGVKMGMLASAPRRKYPKTFKGWFYFLVHRLGFKMFGRQLTMEVGIDAPIYDVDALKNHMNKFNEGEPVIATEKIHGSSARYVYLDGVQYAGSHKQWKHEKSPCIFRKVLTTQPWIGEWCRAHEGQILYGEVTPTQKVVGKAWTYGSAEPQFFAFDIRMPDGTWRKPWASLPMGNSLCQHRLPVGKSSIVCHNGHTICLRCASRNPLQMPPIIYYGVFNIAQLKVLTEGPSMITGADHMREGLVISPVVERHVPGLGRLQLKLVSNAYLEAQGK